MGNKYEELEKLNDLFQRGVITEAEYEREKVKLLNGGFSSTQAPLFGMAENSYLMMMHLSLLSGCIYPLLGIIAPLLLWLINKDNNPNVDRHGRVIMNYMISFAIYMGAVVLMLIPFGMFFSIANMFSPLAFFSGFFPLFALPILCIVFIVMAAIRANNGVLWHYPLSIRFFKVDE
ncbi:MAG: DUF4870 domain-containing protein [Marinilabiliaceae bacterium]|nr:DUF4870 domain-containing protein [Marinilabiliaceae bacterium]